MDFTASLEPRFLTKTEVGRLPTIEEGTIKVVVLDGITGRSSIVSCPRHGDIVMHTHAGKFDTITVHAEHRIR